MKLQAIFFDLDGVLVDVSRSYRRAIEETVAHFTGRAIEPGTIQRYKNLGGLPDDWKLTHAIVTDAGIQVSPARVFDELQRQYRGENWEGFIQEERPLVQMRTLERLHLADLVLGIVSTRPAAEVEWTLDRFGWKRYFPLVIPREMLEGRGKPDPYPLLRALAILDAAGRPTPPAQAIYVGATVDDVTAALRAGIWSVGVTTLHADRDAQDDPLKKAGAHHVLHSVDAITGLIERFAEFIPHPPDIDDDLD
ncbi:MAG: HAD hydrolase-like protein [Rhodothermales bacterium]